MPLPLQRKSICHLLAMADETTDAVLWDAVSNSKAEVGKASTLFTELVKYGFL